MFGSDGRFLGDVDIPVGLRISSASTFVDGALVVAVFEDEAGTILVKRYRLVLPGEQ